MEQERDTIQSLGGKDITAEAIHKSYNYWGFYDWFCKDTSLEARGRALSSRLRSVLKANETGKKFEPDKTYVWFKNNCPAWTSGTYDDLRIADLETGDIVYTIIPKMPTPCDQGSFNVWSTPRVRTFEQSEVWGRENGFEKALVEGTWKEVLKFFS
jgi:hypothetical protein